MVAFYGCIHDALVLNCYSDKNHYSTLLNIEKELVYFCPILPIVQRCCMSILHVTLVIYNYQKTKIKTALLTSLIQPSSGSLCHLYHLVL